LGSRGLPDSRIMLNLRDNLLSPVDGAAGFSPDKVRIVLAYRYFLDYFPSYHHYQLFSANSQDDNIIG